GIVGDWISRLACSTGAWHRACTGGADLEAIVGGAAFPALGAAYARDAAPLREVPMWATGILCEPTARAVARAAFGEKATRPVISTFARAFAPGLPANPPADGPRPFPNLAVLALGLIGAPVLQPDELALLLRGARAATVPSGEQIRTCQQAVRRIGPARARRVLSQAGESDQTMAVLTEMAAMYLQVGQLIRGQPAARLEALHAQCLDLMPGLPNPGHHDGEREEIQQAARGEDAVPLIRVRERRPPGLEGGTPQAPSLYPSGTALPFPSDIRALEHRNLGALRIVLPRTTDELVAWGQILGNCLGSYASAAAAGRSWLIGVEVADRLAYCMEVSPKRTICQFAGHANRAVPARDAEVVLRYLAQQRVVEPTSAANLKWYR
ncbi:MAG TPA: PcfJ domain-containing protein, partial [Acidimicrobiales bacterium]|nr:PcfJ domain-containing protein [Acidimicrobiales bacterium]